MSAFALTALILLTVDGRAGEWVLLDDIASRLGVSVDRLQPVCDELVATNQVLHAARWGRQYYGVRVEGVAP